jgi:ATP-dependent DNA helicase DinG
VNQDLWLHCRLPKVEDLDVYLSPIDGESIFAHEDAEAPEGLHLSLVPEPEGNSAQSSKGLPMMPVVLAMDPARSTEWRASLDEVLQLDNRIDAESALADLVVHLDRRVRAWREVTGSMRATRENTLRRHDSAFARFLSAWPTGIATATQGVFPDLESPRAKSMAEPDDEHWAGWRGRETGEILGENGGLARLLGDGFEPRAGQLDMGLAVEKTLMRGDHLMCEAGTGIGKSIGYLVPALLHGARDNARVVVSTHTHTLQTQLIQHDLPLLQRLGYPGRARRLLGRNNYLCRRQLMRAMAAPVRDADAARAQFALAVWAATSNEGMREELADHPWFATVWKAHFESIEPCSPHICHRDPVCFVVKARRDAREAHVVVVNHALLMMDVQGEQSLIGPAGVLVVDEAHQLPEVARHALSFSLSSSSTRVHENLAGDRERPGGMRAVFAKMAALEGGVLADAAKESDVTLDGFLAAYFKWLDGLQLHFQQRLAGHAARPGQHRIHDAGEAFGPVRDLDARLRERAKAFATALATMLGRSGGGDPDNGAEREALANLLEYHDELARRISFVQEVGDEDFVYWVDWAGESGLRALVAAPLEVSSPLASAWDDYYSSVIMTSATLAIESDFMPFAESVGFDRVKRFTETLQVESPFRATEQSRIFTALDLPGPDDPHFTDLVTHLLAAIARSVATKMLVLSTSYRLIDQIEPRLKEAMAATPSDFFERGQPVTTEILAQRPASSRDALIARFRNAPAAVLLATGSFWEGMDFPGDQLEVLVVPRLPFAVPTDPVVEGRFEHARRLGRDPFESVALVDAVLRLKQGVGRLLRTTEDRGVVILLDHRLQTKAYGVKFLNSMPRLIQILPDHADIVSGTVDFLLEGRQARRGKS